MSRLKCNINLFKQNVLVYSYKLDESISNLGGAGWHFVFQILIEHSFSSYEDHFGVYGLILLCSIRVTVTILVPLINRKSVDGSMRGARKFCQSFFV